MSYLDVPRLNFVGQFHTTPSTINNNTPNFNPATPLTRTNVLWGAHGNNAFTLVGCHVTSVVGHDGVVATRNHPLIGASVESPCRPSAAKMVDLHPDMQGVPELFGFRITITRADRSEPVLAGTMRPESLRDLWHRYTPKWSTLEGGGGVWQSVLKGLTWEDPGDASALRTLREISPRALSVRLAVYGFQVSRGMTGQVFGAIGPRRSGEPARFVAARRLFGTLNLETTLTPLFGKLGSASTPARKRVVNDRIEKAMERGWGPAPFMVDTTRRRLVIDLANSIQTATPGGPSKFASVAVGVAGTTRPGTLPSIDTPIAPVRTAGLRFRRLGGIVEIPLTPTQLTLLQDRPLVISLPADTGSGTTVLQEDEAGRYVDVDTQTLRLNPGDTSTVTLRALRFGRPWARKRFAVSFQQGSMPWNYPASALRFGTQVKTDTRGRATISLRAGNPAAPNGPVNPHIDGQIYVVGGDWTRYRGIQVSAVKGFLIRVFNGFEVEQPSWTAVQPILASYARLYPGMTALLDLEDLESVTKYARAILQSLRAPFDRPDYMPVTRDLSRDRRAALITFLERHLTERR